MKAPINDITVNLTHFTMESEEAAAASTSSSGLTLSARSALRKDRMKGRIAAKNRRKKRKIFSVNCAKRE